MVCEESGNSYQLRINLMLFATPIQDMYQVERLRQIRNLTASGFSTFNGYITKDEQIAWWMANHSRIKAWLYGDQRTNWYVGYGLLRQDDDGNWWNSLAVLPQFHGLGYGSYITHDLLGRHDSLVYATVRRDNLPAIAMHHPSDWDTIYGPDSSLVYFRSKYGPV
jgi:GNAT superfamily N-acetyltransferase